MERKRRNHHRRETLRVGKRRFLRRPSLVSPPTREYLQGSSGPFRDVGQACHGSSGSLSTGRNARIIKRESIIGSNYPCSSSTTNSAPMNLFKHFSKPTRVIIRGRPTRGRLCFAEGNALRINSKAGPRNAYYFVMNVPTKEYSILYNCPYPEVRRMWLPKAETSSPI